MVHPYSYTLDIPTRLSLPCWAFAFRALVRISASNPPQPIFSSLPLSPIPFPELSQLSLLRKLLTLRRRPLLLRHLLAPTLSNIQALDPVFLLLVNDVVFGVQLAQLLDGADARRVVRGDGLALEALVQDAGTQTDARGVEGRVEDARLGLDGAVLERSVQRKRGREGLQCCHVQLQLR